MNQFNASVARFSGKIWQLLLLILHPLGRLLRLIFGAWQAPTWWHWLGVKLAPLGQWMAQRAGLSLLAGLIVIAAGAAPFLAKVDWQSKWARFQSVQADKIEAKHTGVTLSRPDRTAIEYDGKPHPVALNFSASAAPLALVGKEARDVQIKPAIAGKWLWVSATRLEFTPNEDWPIDLEYTITLGAKALAPHVNVDREFEFRTPSFEMRWHDPVFYQDPIQLNLRKAVFEIAFSHPVDPIAFEKKLKLVTEAADQKMFSNTTDAQKLTVVYDKFRLLATVYTEPLRIPAQSSSLSLTVESGLTAARGGNAIKSDQTKAVLIPGLYSLDIAEMKQLMVTGDTGEPENVLQVATGMAVNEKEMARNISAWLLPATHEVNGEDSAVWADPEEVTAEVLKESKAVPLTSIPAERENQESHSFKFASEPGRYLYVRIKKGLKSAGGYQLGVERNEIFRIKRSAPELSIMSKGSLLALSGEKKLPLLVRDLPGVKVEIGRLLPQQLQHLVMQSQGEMSKPEFYNGITPDSLTERFEKKIPLSLKQGKTHYESIDFAQYLRADASDRRGIFIVMVQAYDPNANSDEESSDGPRPYQYGDYESEGEGEGETMESDPDTVDLSTMRDRRLVIVTDLGIISKLALDGSRDVFVQSIADGNAVGAATVEIWAKNGSVLLSQVTDSNGMAHLPSLTGFNREKTPAVLIVKKAGDLSFLPLNRADRNLDYSRFDIGGLHASGLPNQMTAYLFSDRGIYRPGDTMNIGIAAKSAGWAQKLVDLPVEAEVIDARGLVVRKQKLKLGVGGMAEFSHPTQETSPTGNYTINLNLARDTGSVAPGASETAALRLGSLTVKVQEFMPDRMKVVARLSRETEEGWISPKDLSAKINVQNLFGTPAPERRVDASLTLLPSYPAFRSHPDFIFFDPMRAKEKFQDELAKASTDAQGNADLPLGLQRYAQASYQLHLLVKAFEPEGGRSVAAEATALVSDRPYLLGYKADGDLDYVNRNAVRNVRFVAIDPKAKRSAVKKLQLLRIERKVVSVLIKQPNGLFKYESKTNESVLSESAFEISAAGTNVMLSTQTPGNFSYAVRDENGLILSKFDYSVAGTGNVSRSLDRNAELQLSLNKKDYNPGEEIEINIRAPYVGAGLITIERDKVFVHKWFKANSTSSVQKITLPKDFEGNAYVSVQFARDIASNEIFMSPMSYGVVPFATSLARRTNPISLQAPATVKPGQVVKIKLESKAAARAVVFAVDEGILQVARYQNPDPLKFFFQKKALEVGTQQTMDLVLPEFRKLMSAAAPGGDGEGLLGKNLNPFKRKTDKPVVFWSGVVDVVGSKEFTYTVPESFNGSLRIMAVVMNDETAGAASTSTTVRGDVILLPNLPIAITPGDEVEVGLGVANNTLGSGKDAVVNVSMSLSPGLEVVGSPQQSLKISEKSEAATKFVIRAKAGDAAQLGSASVVFTAQVKDAKARLSTDLSIRPASAYVTLVQTGLFKGTGEVVAQAQMYPNFKHSEAAISTSPWAFTSGLIKYLDVYPYGCTEQITSQIFPAVIIGSQAQLAKELLKGSRNGSELDLPDVRKSFERYLSAVRSRQTADGGFAMWPGASSDLFATSYVVNLLIEAKAHQLAVPNDLLQRANGYLQTQLAQPNTHFYLWRAQAYAAYLLTRQGVVTSAALTNLREFIKGELSGSISDARKSSIERDLGMVYLAASFQILKQDSLARDLLEPALKALKSNEDPRSSWYWDYYYDPLVQSSTVVQIIAKHFPKRIADLPQNYWQRLSDTVRDGYYQTHSASTVLLAVDAYASAAQQSAAGKVAVTAIDAKGLAKALELPKQFAIASMTVPNNAVKLKLSNQGELPLFYSFAEAGYERNLPKEAKSQGLEILHEFLDGKGTPVTEVTLGDEVQVRVRVRAIGRERVAQVALVDVLPGGLEPVLTSPSDDDAADTPLWRRRLGGKSTWQIQYADIREDRVIFYGDVSSNLTEVTYKARATNVGTFVVPAAYGEAMYEHRIFARSAASSLKVKPVAK